VWRGSLQRHGWIEGKNLLVDYRYSEGHAERLPALAAELVALKPDVIVTSAAPPTLAAQAATSTSPSCLSPSGAQWRLGSSIACRGRAAM